MKVGQLAVSLKGLAQRFAFGLLVLTAFAVMVIGKADTVIIERVRSAVVDIAAPVLAVVSRPVQTVNDAVAEVEDLIAMREELTRLREENARLLSWQNVAQRLEAENKALRSFFAFSSGPQATFITARVVGDAGSAFVRSMLLNAGARQGVRNGQAVMTADGLAGRITEVGETSARVLLINDINSRIPVLVERTRERAVLAGDNSRQARLTLMPPGMTVEAGDRVVTSGHGGTYPAGLPVGVVASVSEKAVRIEPLVDWNRLEFVRVVDFGIAGILPPQPSLVPLPRRGAQAPLP
ncbi:MAG: mreC [Alphaproteobacteria bacterium]|jgi:rod shape-determining protein MreC|nr:mreC [Alphaproteobacteria bacterium]